MKNMEEKVVVLSEVQNTQNQVFVTKGLDIKDTTDLTLIVKNDNVNSYEDYFWFSLIYNVDKTKSISEKKILECQRKTHFRTFEQYENFT